ncbi:MAG: HAD family hydrolase [Clostridia bacterium]|nr:HAD family hydrolase [Clostridia bacterium]
MKNFVFDLYGTLADIHTDEGRPQFRKSMAKYFRDNNFWQRYVELCKSLETGDELCEIDLNKVFSVLVPKDPFGAATYFRKKSRLSFKPYKGVYTLLQGLKAKGARLYILSNAQSCFTCMELHKLKFPQYFDGVELSSDFGKKKPAKEFFEHIVQKYGLNKSETVYVGNDFRADVLGAKSAGLSAVYIKSNRSPATDDLEEVREEAIFATDSFKELTDYLLSI